MALEKVAFRLAADCRLKGRTMNQADIATLMEGIAPVVRDFVEACFRPLADRVGAMEKRLAEPTSLPVEFAELSAAHEDLRKTVNGFTLPTAEANAALMPKPEDGKSVSREDVSALIKEVVAPSIDELGDCIKSVREIVASLPEVPTAEEVAALIPVPKDGIDGAKGEDGLPGRDGVDGANGIDGAKGIDGAAGRDGIDGAKGEDGLPGRDGKSVEMDDLLLPIETIIARKLLELPKAVDGRDGLPGLPGRDGADGKDGDPGRDADPEFLRVAVQDEVQRQVSAPLADAYKGVWKAEAYKRGNAVTWGGSLWIALRDTEVKPETNADWQLAVKRGRDGKDGEAPKGPAKVKLT